MHWNNWDKVTLLICRKVDLIYIRELEAKDMKENKWDLPDRS